MLIISLVPSHNALAQNTLTNVTTLINKGNALSRLGNYTQAIQYYDKALAIDPNNAIALYNKGNTLNNLGNYTQLYNTLTRF